MFTFLRNRKSYRELQNGVPPIPRLDYRMLIYSTCSKFTQFINVRHVDVSNINKLSSVIIQCLTETSQVYGKS